MSPTTDLLSILAGIAMEFIAVFNRHFYWRKGWNSGDKEMPRWFGRLFFGFIGAVFIAVGVAHLFLER